MRLHTPRNGTRTVTALLSLVLATGALAGTANSAPPAPTDDPVDRTTTLVEDTVGGETDPTPEPEPRPTPDFKLATLNLHNTMSTSQMREDIRKIARGGATVIGMQERRGTKGMVRAALPDHWRLAMPTTKDGTDDNPIAWNSRVWKKNRHWARLLASKTWHRDGSGHQAVDQYAVMAVLEHRKSGHRIRAASLHMPSQIQTQEGGPNWAQRDRVEAFWRMAKSLRTSANRTPDRQQFVTLCDCNVSHGRDNTKHLLKGKVSRPLELMSNYSEGGYRRGWRIDYVLAHRHEPYLIKGWKAYNDLNTDHPGVVARFAHR